MYRTVLRTQPSRLLFKGWLWRRWRRRRGRARDQRDVLLGPMRPEQVFGRHLHQRRSVWRLHQERVVDDEAIEHGLLLDSLKLEPRIGGRRHMGVRPKHIRRQADGLGLTGLVEHVEIIWLQKHG